MFSKTQAYGWASWCAVGPSWTSCQEPWYFHSEQQASAHKCPKWNLCDKEQVWSSWAWLWASKKACSCASHQSTLTAALPCALAKNQKRFAPHAHWMEQSGPGPKNLAFVFFPFGLEVFAGGASSLSAQETCESKKRTADVARKKGSRSRLTWV